LLPERGARFGGCQSWAEWGVEGAIALLARLTNKLAEIALSDEVQRLFDEYQRLSSQKQINAEYIRITPQFSGFSFLLRSFKFGRLLYLY
jgi:hypothetical protein